MYEKQYDTIIIGSGAGGLSAAICLAREGQKVLVLEQHDVPGGWCHSFYLEGHRFTPGVHYIGLLDEGESTNNLYKGLGIANDLVFFRMAENGYEHLHMGDDRFDYPSNFDDLVAKLCERFPKEKKGIVKYLTLVNKVNHQLQLIPKLKTFWEKLFAPFHTKEMGKYALFSLKRVIDWHLKDEKLKKILNVQFGDHGMPPSKASFPLHCAIMGHYFQGGYYPMGGGGAIIKAKTNLIKKYGGTVQTRARVQRILTKGDAKKTAIGVELSNGEKIHAKRIISNADPETTYRKLVGEENLSKKLIKKLDKTKYSCTSLMLFLTVDMDVAKAGLDSGNIWFMADEGLDEIYNDLQRIDIENGPYFKGMFVSCTSLKDPVSFDGKHHTIEAITYINYDAFKKFEHEGAERSQEYLSFKEKLSKKMLATLEKIVPSISNHIVNKELGTPITNEYYVNTTNGSVYGTEKSLKQIGPFAYKPKSEIENLYLCGASIVSHGIAGASYSGVQTAGVILGKHQDELLQPDPAQTLRIYNAEDTASFPEWMQRKQEVRKARLKANDKRKNLEV
ncbi:phytoene desaturase family protein [Marinirhabdus gelatinilytica]|uniref:Phytoene dehydrogenase-like protein n=1 Tax=Marinirhabdus gelatinilytica TaxID=1703343 RepID=A0A370QBS2_9FLAO|nr:NAD(P)/FAD-dependent oxidoreductase [Marinirhabdus gelatinilytica]RDK85450.1 phytoene dehydrogenase-like protein [Marinirhabdus gelatinilytica]